MTCGISCRARTSQHPLTSADCSDMAAIWRLMLDWFRLVRSARARPYLVVTLIVDCTLVFVFLVALQSYLPEDRGYASLPGYALAAYGSAKLAGQLFGGGL